MRISMTGPFGLHPNRTMSSRALNLAKALVRRDHEVTLFMPPWQTPQEADRSWQEEGVTVRYTALGGQLLATARNLLRDTLDWSPEIVHIFKPKAYSGLVQWWLWQFRRHQQRLVLDMDDWEGAGGWNDLAPYSSAEKRFFAWQEKWGMGHAHAVTVASHALESLAWSQGVTPAMVHYLPNGSGLTRAGRQLSGERIRERRRELGLTDRPVLLIYSRLFEFDTERLVALLAGVKALIPDLAILFIGESLYAADGEALRAQLEREQLLPAVIDLGWVDEKELPLLLRCADVAVYLMDDTLINRAKCPVKLADLIGAGLPVVAEDVGQVPAYVINGRTGRIRQTGDVEGLIADTAALVQDSRMRLSYSEAAREHYLCNFDWDRLAGRLDLVYQQTPYE